MPLIRAGIVSPSCWFISMALCYVNKSRWARAIILPSIKWLLRYIATPNSLTLVSFIPLTLSELTLKSTASFLLAFLLQEHKKAPQGSPVNSLHLRGLRSSSPMRHWGQTKLGGVDGRTVTSSLIFSPLTYFLSQEEVSRIKLLLFSDIWHLSQGCPPGWQEEVTYGGEKKTYMTSPKLVAY